MSRAKLIYDDLKGYKYRVRWSRVYAFAELSGLEFCNEYLKLREGILEIEKGYAWDGASGPTWDDKTNQRGSLVHDALYQILRALKLKKVRHAEVRKFADEKLIELCLEDGMWRIRAWLWHKAIRLLGIRSSKRERYPRGKIVEIK